MSPPKKSLKIDRNFRHAFIYINILKTDMGLNFSEIAEQLNADNYRTRGWGKFTAESVSQTWERGKIKYRLEYSNHRKLLVPRPRAQIINEIITLKTRFKLVDTHIQIPILHKYVKCIL